MDNQFSLKTDEWIHEPEKKLRFNRELFTVVSSKYGFVTKVLSFGRDRHWKHVLINALPESDSPNCLDLACGPGDITFLLEQKYSGGQIVGLDVCESMIELAKQQNESPQVRFEVGDMCDTELSAASMDMVTGGYALRNAPNLNSAFTEINRVLRGGGTAAFLEFSKPANKILQRIQYFGLWFWGSLWGLLLHGNPSIYAYIAKSLKQYPDRPALHKLVQEHGFEVIDSIKFYFGSLEVLILRKPLEPTQLQEESSDEPAT